MFLHPTYRAGRKCNLGQYITNIWTKEGVALKRGTALVGRPIKAKGIQLCLN